MRDLTFVSAQNREQRQLIRSIVENPVTIVKGIAGSGKTYVSIGYAVQQLVKRPETCQQIIISRPLVCAGKSLPALPGSLDEKMDPYWYQIQVYFEHFAGKDNYTRWRRDEKIIFQPLELMRGMNFHKNYVIVTEAQNATYEQIKMLLTRIGDSDSRVILDGDIEQTDLNYGGDYACPIDVIAEKLTNIPEVGQIELIESLRHPIVEKIARML